MKKFLGHQISLLEWFL